MMISLPFVATKTSYNFSLIGFSIKFKTYASKKSVKEISKNLETLFCKMYLYNYCIKSFLLIKRFKLLRIQLLQFQ